jgi:hypothetical protein
VAFESFRERLRDEGLEPSWQRTYNAGSNPVSLRLRRSDLDRPTVQGLLRASFEILEPGTSAWSERHPQVAPADEVGIRDTLQVERRLDAGDGEAAGR